MSGLRPSRFQRLLCQNSLIDGQKGGAGFGEYVVSCSKMKFHMKKLLLAGIFLIGATVSYSQPFAGNAAPGDTLTRDERMGWWREARFGMFIHWGVYAELAGEYDGHTIGKAAEWIMNRGKIPVAKYHEAARKFNPVKYDADAWVRTARDAGMKYIVITAKHHDGDRKSVV